MTNRLRQDASGFEPPTEACPQGRDTMSETVETAIGSTVLETRRRVYNPTTDKFQDLTKLSETGYCRQFLALWAHIDDVETINVGQAPVMTFEKDRFELREMEDHYALVKREPESKFGERVLEEADAA